MIAKDGIYRWTYEVNMWKNPVILITLLKVLSFGASVPILLVTVLALFEGGLADALKALVGVSVGVVLTIGFLLALAYPLVAIMGGGKYCMIFEMDEKGVKHIQMQKQFKKAQVLGIITALAGTTPTTTGIGLLAGAKQSSYSQFSKVKSIRAQRRRQVIYVNERLERNQIYVPAEDFDQVLDYLVSHCKQARVRVK